MALRIRTRVTRGLARTANPVPVLCRPTYRLPSYRSALPSAPAACASSRSWRRDISTSRPFLEKKYTENHEWVELDSNQNDGTIGISNYAAKALGEVVYVELPQANTEVAAGDVIGSVESTKSASDIYSPVGGTITEANNALEEKPGTINKEPEGNGWIAKITVDAQSQGEQLDNLMDAKKYEKFTEEAGDEH